MFCALIFQILPSGYHELNLVKFAAISYLSEIQQ
jgi:hypothetical protein